MSKEIYELRQKMREVCFYEGKCYINEYKGGIKEYICTQDHLPCLFHCLELIDIVPCEECRYSEELPDCHKLLKCKELDILVKRKFSCIEGGRKFE